MTTHFPPLSKSMYFTSRVTCVPSLTDIHESIVRQSQCQKKSSRVNILYTWAWIKELLPWQGTFRHCQNVGNSHLYLKANVCTKSHSNQWKHSETITINVRKTLGLTFCTRMHGQRDRYHGKVCRSHLHLKANMTVPSLSEIHVRIQTITKNIRKNLD